MFVSVRVYIYARALLHIPRVYYFLLLLKIYPTLNYVSPSKIGLGPGATIRDNTVIGINSTVQQCQCARIQDVLCYLKQGLCLTPPRNR